MSKRINLISNDTQKINNFENINLSELESIFNYSCEILICKYFSLFDESVSFKALEVLLDKIKPTGQIVIGVANLRNLCSDYIKKQINNEVFFGEIKNIHNHVSADDIINMIEKSQQFLITDITTNSYNDFITITRIK